MKSHMPFDALPIFDDVRYIHVARDGRDACVSYHNQITRFKPELAEALSKSGLEDETIGKPYPNIPADAAVYFRMWLSEGSAVLPTARRSSPISISREPIGPNVTALTCSWCTIAI